MKPILYEKSDSTYTGNGLGRLQDCISCIVTEERNGIYECDFEYPVTGRNYEEIKIGRVIGVTHEDSDDIQPFDIVSFSRPINGIVTFHCVHISYRLSYVTAVLSNIDSLSEALMQLKLKEQPRSDFYYDTNRNFAGYLGAGDGIPHSVKQILGGMQGSILDTYGGEYEWNRFSVYLHTERGTERDITIRYGLNMLDYNEDYDVQGTYSSCVPYWTDGTVSVVGDKVDAVSLTLTGRDECVPLDLSDKFEAAPTKNDLNRLAVSYMNRNTTYRPSQNIHVEFVRLSDLGYGEFDELLECKLCDTITVVFPDFNGSQKFKIVKTVWDVLRDRYESMELGDLSTTLAEALGITPDTSNTSPTIGDYVIEQDTSGSWTYRKWNSGVSECWAHFGTTSTDNGAWTTAFPPDLFISTPYVVQTLWYGESTDPNRDARAIIVNDGSNNTQLVTYLRTYSGGAYSGNFAIQVLAKGRWK